MAEIDLASLFHTKTKQFQQTTTLNTGTLATIHVDPADLRHIAYLYRTFWNGHLKHSFTGLRLKHDNVLSSAEYGKATSHFSAYRHYFTEAEDGATGVILNLVSALLQQLIDASNGHVGCSRDMRVGNGLRTVSHRAGAPV